MLEKPWEIPHVFLIVSPCFTIFSQIFTIFTIFHGKDLAFPKVHSIVLDDYGTRVGVHRAVDEALRGGQATLRRYVGRAPPWSYDGITEIGDWEGAAGDGRYPWEKLGETMGFLMLESYYTIIYYKYFKILSFFFG
jgi:hypothetical protein